MIFVLLGPPGAGKGTQAEWIQKRLNVPMIVTGATFREAMSSKTPLGERVNSFVKQGLLVPDQVTIELVDSRLSQPDCKNGFLLDGYPRSVPQAEALDQWTLKHKTSMTKVLYFDVPADVVVSRLGGRRVCSKCATTYNLVSQPPMREGICDRCGAGLIVRPDDTEDAIRKRLEVYVSSTAPLLNFYRSRGMLAQFDASQSIEKVQHEIQSIVETLLANADH